MVLSANESKNSLNYYPYFDYLRIILACLVMFSHDHIITWKHCGNLAVQIFFALSGWLIGGALINLAAKDLPRFYFNRACRIWVPYYIALLLLIGASILKDPMDAKWLEFVFYKLLFVYNLFGPPQLESYRYFMPLDGTGNHFWSVNAEEQFYLLAPILLVLVRQRCGRSSLLWALISVVALVMDIYASIVLGVFAAILYKKYIFLHGSIVFRCWITVVVFAAGAGIYYEYNYTFLAPILSIAIVMLLAVRGNPNRFGIFLGGISYPLYLNHWIGVFVGNYFLAGIGLRDSPVRQLVSVMVSIVIAVTLYWYVDRLVLKYRSHLFSPKIGIVIIYIAYSMVFIGVLIGVLMNAQSVPIFNFPEK